MQKSQKTDQPFNLAFLGCGFATSLHSKTFANFKNEIRCYYASRDENKALNYNRKYHGQGYFDSYEAAIHSKNIDIVLVATPPSQHLDLTLLALDRGKHVIVEKPPFLNSADFALVRKMQQTSGCHVFVAENYYYKPLAFKLRAIIHSN
ncbi:MAG: Gfo/Idh/MocA family protein, partial [bacterium]